MPKTELFKTHSFIKELTNAGMDEKQAEVSAEHQLSMLETQIATKANLVDVKEHVSTAILIT
jgi:UDP-N-acetylenolpyruvoylglucosamine reductase